MNDLIERLRSDGADCTQDDCEMAADELERKDKVIDAAIEALKNIAALDYTKAATTGACSLAVRIAKDALAAHNKAGE